MANEYKIHRIDGRGCSMSNLRFRDTVRFEVRFLDDEKLPAYWSPTHFTDQLTPRQINGLRLGCAKAMPKYQAHFDKTGTRFEVDLKKIEDIERAAKKKAQRIASLTKMIPELQAELAALKAAA